jgi:hypothetical protein
MEGTDVILAYAAVCAFINVAAKFLLQPNYFPGLSGLTSADLKALHMRLVGALNSLVIAVGSGMWFIPRISAEHGILIVPVTNEDSLDPQQLICSQLMLGFLLYDCFADWYVNGLTIDMGLHHVLGAISFILINLTGRGGLWMMWIMLAEGSTPFLHIGWLLHKVGNDGPWFQLNGYTLVLTFTLLRAISPALILNSMIAHRALFAGHETLFYILLAITSVFAILNWVWWVKLLKMAGLLPEGGKAKDSKAKSS